MKSYLSQTQTAGRRIKYLHFSKAGGPFWKWSNLNNHQWRSIDWRLTSSSSRYPSLLYAGPGTSSYCPNITAIRSKIPPKLPIGLYHGFARHLYTHTSIFCFRQNFLSGINITYRVGRILGRVPGAVLCKLTSTERWGLHRGRRRYRWVYLTACITVLIVTCIHRG